MQGFQIVVYENGSIESPYKNPVGFDRIIKFWAATRKKAQKEKEKLHQKYDGVIWIRSRT